MYCLYMYLTPYFVVEFLSNHIQYCHCGHVEDEKPHQSDTAEVFEEGVDPDPSRQEDPNNPVKPDNKFSSATVFLSVYQSSVNYHHCRVCIVKRICKINTLWANRI
ncbi:hypothetical protein NQD34_011198 [Periophthalmus magnuspinnatus]|nr:hypothetical protein NQD34_011198 [Periophthalmus magnuspinnatus]